MPDQHKLKYIKRKYFGRVHRSEELAQLQQRLYEALAHLHE